ncbi:MAG: hypothetical protein KGM99_17675, partial [Burkholderiales bacterium]|nr:hypothetical protein [Burkholderiales bacterium]
MPSLRQEIKLPGEGRMLKRSMRTLMQVSFLLMLSASSATAQLQPWGDYPASPVKSPPTTGSEEDTNSDPYAWLESLSEPQVRQWMRRQTEFTGQVLQRIGGRDAMLQRLKMLDAGRSSTGDLQVVGDAQFYMSTGADRQTRLYMRNALTGAERLLLLAASNESIDFFSPSPDGSLIAVGLSRNDRRSAAATLRLIRTRDASALKDQLQQLAAGADDAAWKADSSTVYYLRKG